MIKNTVDLCKLSEKLIAYLQGKIGFSDDGFPIFKKEMFLEFEPEIMVPFQNRNCRFVSNPQKTVLCHYCGDRVLYRRFEKVLDEVSEYKKYLATAGLDITVTSDMDCEWQDLIMLINQLFLAVLAVNGIKIVMNARIGSAYSVKNLNGFPKRMICATSFLGCDKIRSGYDLSFISKVMHIYPSTLLIYGKHDKLAEKQLDTMGIKYRIYTDMHRLTKGVA